MNFFMEDNYCFYVIVSDYDLCNSLMLLVFNRLIKFTKFLKHYFFVSSYRITLKYMVKFNNPLTGVLTANSMLLKHHSMFFFILLKFNETCLGCDSWCGQWCEQIYARIFPAESSPINFCILKLVSVTEINYLICVWF
jgi:hypothetical protein